MPIEIHGPFHMDTFGRPPQHLWSIDAVDMVTGAVVGSLRYSEFRDAFRVEWLEVEESHRGGNIAMQMLRRLAEYHGVRLQDLTYMRVS